MSESAETKVKFTEDMTILQAKKSDPRVEQVLAYFHIGACHHCQVDESLTLGKVCEDFGVPKELLLKALNSLS